MLLDVYHPGIQASQRFALCVVTLALAGCNNVQTTRSLHAGAPALSEESARTNPNGPYIVSDRSSHLRKRPALLDINAVPPCDAADLSLFESGANVDGDRRTVRLNLVNHAPGPCRLGGYPAVSLLREDGSLLGDVSIDKVSPTRLEATIEPAASLSPVLVAQPDQLLRPSAIVLLAPAGQASFELGWTTGNSGSRCDIVGAIAVSAPGSTHLFSVRHTLRICESRITVTALAEAGGL